MSISCLWYCTTVVHGFYGGNWVKHMWDFSAHMYNYLKVKQFLVSVWNITQSWMVGWFLDKPTWESHIITANHLKQNFHYFSLFWLFMTGRHKNRCLRATMSSCGHLVANRWDRFCHRSDSALWKAHGPWCHGCGIKAWLCLLQDLWHWICYLLSLRVRPVKWCKNNFLQNFVKIKCKKICKQMALLKG